MPFSLSNSIQELFPQNYAEQRSAFVASQPNRASARSAYFSRTAHPGSDRYMNNLRSLEEDMLRRHGGILPKKIEERMAGAKKAHIDALAHPHRARTLRNLGRAIGPVATLGFAAYAMWGGEGGSTGDRAAAAAGEVAGGIGGGIGWFAGGATGAAIGSAILPGVGTVIGGLVGSFAGSFAGYSAGSGAVGTAYDFANRLVDNEKRKRGLEWNDWAGQTQAFNTQRASTMRQRSLEAMNRGMMNSRSLMGREASFMHR
jgi:hypothetical protein